MILFFVLFLRLSEAAELPSKQICLQEAEAMTKLVESVQCRWDGRTLSADRLKSGQCQGDIICTDPRDIYPEFNLTYQYHGNSGVTCATDGGNCGNISETCRTILVTAEKNACEGMVEDRSVYRPGDPLPENPRGKVYP